MKQGPRTWAVEPLTVDEKKQAPPGIDRVLRLMSGNLHWSIALPPEIWAGVDPFLKAVEQGDKQLEGLTEGNQSRVLLVSAMPAGQQ